MWGDMILFNGAAGSPMPTRNVVLTEYQEKVIETLVSSGRYQNASEVLREGLRLVEQRAAEDACKAGGFA
jgi:antitoxin ParD1/3/4